MVTDAIMAPLLAVVTAVVDKLPTGSALPLPTLTPVWSVVAQIESLFPVQPILLTATGLLAAGVVFIGIRLVLLVWNLVWP